MFLSSKSNSSLVAFSSFAIDVTGVIELPAGVEMVMPGDNIEMTVELIHPIALEQGTKFSIREGGRTVGAGSISEIIE